MEIEKKRLFDITFLKLIRLSQFFSTANVFFWTYIVCFGIWLGLYFIFTWFPVWEIGIEYIIEWLDIDKSETNSYMEKGYVKWITQYWFPSLLIIWFIYYVYKNGLQEIFDYLSKLFGQLSEYKTLDIILAIMLFGIFPFAIISLSPFWLGFGLMWLPIYLHVALDRWWEGSQKLPDKELIFHYLDVDKIIDDVVDDDFDKKWMKLILEQIYSEDTYENQIRNIGHNLIFVHQKRKGEAFKSSKNWKDEST